jgi:hypothetical protein
MWECVIGGTYAYGYSKIEGTTSSGTSLTQYSQYRAATGTAEAGCDPNVVPAGKYTVRFFGRDNNSSHYFEVGQPISWSATENRGHFRSTTYSLSGTSESPVLSWSEDHEIS